MLAYDQEETTLPTLEQRELKFYKERVVPYSLEFTNYWRWSMLDRTNVLQQGMWVKTINRYYFHKNQLWSIIWLSNGSGDIVIEYGYDDYGKVFVKTWQWEYISIENYEWNDYSNVRLYTSREYDKELSRYYYRARMYSPELGRFTSVDPIWPKDDINLYSYVWNNPINRIDPMGLEKVLVVVWFREEWTPYELDDNWNIIWDYNSMHRSALYYLKKKLEDQGHKFDLVFVKTFEEFDNAINEKNRDMIYFIWHWSPKSIDLNSHDLNSDHSFINTKNLKKDEQTQEQSERLNWTQLCLLSCQTWNDTFRRDSIWKKIHKHYNFKTTYAPNNDITASWDILSRNSRDWKMIKWEFNIYK